MSQEFVIYDDGSVSIDATATPEARHYHLATRMAAEVIGTFMLVLGIVGTATMGFMGDSSIVTISLAGGLMLMAAIAVFAHVSGGHFNPIVTLGLAIVGRASWRDVAPYWTSQLAGASLSALVLWAIIPSTLPPAIGMENAGALIGRTANGWADLSPLAVASGGQTEFAFISALLVEVIIAALFMAVVIGVTNRRAKIAYPALIIGMTLMALHIFSWPVTNTSFNPARSFASVLFSGDGQLWEQLWLFFVAPMAGAALAALCYRAFAPLGDFHGDAADGLYDAVHGDDANETWDIDIENTELEEATKEANSVDVIHSFDWSKPPQDAPEGDDDPVAADESVETTDDDSVDESVETTTPEDEDEAKSDD